ncbi:hypothetical protein [Salinifilum ghardaiensis]
MARLGELFPGRKLQHEGDQDGAGRKHDPGGPLDLDSGVVYLAPPEREDATPHDSGTDTAAEDAAE